MKRVGALVALSVVIAACGSTAPAPAAPPVTATKPYANLAQMMRAIPFPASNIIFDAQSVDPGAKKEPSKGGGGATDDYSNMYGGWVAVENAALALQETANLLTVPGRMCENGKPAPLDNDDFKKFTKQLADAGAAAYKAAQSKSVDNIVEVSGTVTEACMACHEVYREKPDNADRCVAGPKK